MRRIARPEFLKKSALLAMCGISIPDSIQASEKNKHVFVSANEGTVFQLPHMKVSIKVSEKSTDEEFALFEEITEPGFGTPLHAHANQWEVFEVLEGKYKIRANDEIFIAEAGSIAIIPPNTPHAYININ